MTGLALRLGFDDHAWQLAWTLSDFLAWNGHWPDHQTVHRHALRAAERSGSKEALAYSHRGLGVANARLGRHDTRRHYERALQLFGEIGDHTGQGTTHINLASFHEADGDYPSALRHEVRTDESAYSSWNFMMKSHIHSAPEDQHAGPGRG